ncbi:radical SAM protein [Enterococcus hirae]|nr:radical SAM protein [Enterococcus hirae]
MSDLKIESVKKYYPKSAGIIMTFACNAKCAECCFECSPQNPVFLKKEDIQNIIDRIAEIPTINFIVWTGGEVFFYYNLLKFGISYAFEKGIKSRVVSNGYWASSQEKAKKKLVPLVENGLVELNISTGDNHQEYISFERVMNAILAGIDLGVFSVVTVEKTANSKFKLEDVYKSNQYLKIIQLKKQSLFKAMSTVWVSFHEDQKYTYDSSKLNLPEIVNGCDNLFSMVVADPHKQALSCCGISVEYIDEFQLGEITSEKNSLKKLYDLQKYDFMKQWVYVDGPIKIMEKVKKWNPAIKEPQFFHYCQICAYIFNDNLIKETIFENYHEILEDVQNRFINKIYMKTLLRKSISKEVN